MNRFTTTAIVLSLIAGTIIGWAWIPGITIVVSAPVGVCEVQE